MNLKTYLPGVYTADHLHFPIPRALFPGSFGIVWTRIMAHRAYVAGEATHAGLLYKIQGLRNPPRQTQYEIPFHISGRNGLRGLGYWIDVAFVIPAWKLIGKDGGQIDAYFYTLSSSTGPEIYVDDFRRQFATVTHPPAEGVYYA